MGPPDFYLSYMDIKLPAQCLIDRPGVRQQKEKALFDQEKRRMNGFLWKALGKKLDLPPIYS
jgi:hypothetical protein